MDIEEIIISGDSAGSHLTSSTSLLISARHFHPPIALILIYPIFSVDMSKFIPSAMLAIDEEVIN
jgi:acetyl esterase/lipase